MPTSVFRCLVLLLASFCIYSARAAPVRSADIVVGQIVDRSPLGVEVSRDFAAGAKIWFDHLNKQGGINGERIVVRTRDGEGDPRSSADAARALIEDEHVDVLFGVIGDVAAGAVADSGLLTKDDVVMFGPTTGRWATPPLLNIRLLRAPYDTEIAHAIEHFRKLGLTRFVIVQSDSGAGTQVANAARRQLGNIDLPVVTIRESVGVDVQAIASLRKLAPQALIVAAESITTANLLRAYAPAESGIFVIGTSAVNPRTVADLAGVQARTLVISQVVPDPQAGQLAVTREHLKLMDLYLAEPPNQQTLEGFIAAKALTEALKSVPRGASRAAISDLLRRTRRIDVGGFTLDFASTAPASNYVDLTLVRADGTLLH